MSSIEAIRERLEQLFAEVSETIPKAGTLSSEVLGRPDTERPKGWIWELDLDGKYTWTSPEVEHIFGVPADATLGRNFSDIGFDARSKDLIDEQIRDNAPIERLIAKAINRSGNTIEIFIRALHKQDRQGNPSGYRGVAQIVEGAGESPELVDLAPPERPPQLLTAPSVPEIAPSWGEVLGYEADESGVSAIETSENPVEAGAEASYGSILVPLRVQDEIIGTIELERSDAQMWTDDDHDLAEAVAHEFALALQDARSYQLTQQALEEMREADRLKSQFLANMSHELRTPLNSIIGFSKVILKGIDGPISDKQEEDLSAIYNAGQHLLGLINDILDLSRIEAGKMELAFTEVDLGDIIRGVMSTGVGLVKEKSIELILDIPEDLPPLQADNIRIRQVLLNLVSNAAKFTEEGHIGISARMIKRGSQRDIVIAVFDTGPGIHPADQEKIFEPFSQVDASPTRKTGGTGLGLSICRHLVELHGGIIWVESIPGEGSTFAFTLPYSPPDRPTQTKQPLVLGIHRDMDVLKIFRDALEHEAFRFHNLTRPDHAIEVARALKPDLLLFNMHDASLDDWRLLTLIRQEAALDTLPVVVTAYDRHTDHGYKFGMRDLIVDPLRGHAVEEIFSSAFGASVQEARVLAIVEQSTSASLRAFFENLGAMDVLVHHRLERVKELMEKQDLDGILLSLTLPWQSYAQSIAAIENMGEQAGGLPIVGLLTDVAHDAVLERAQTLVSRSFEQDHTEKNAFFDELIGLLRGVNP